MAKPAEQGDEASGGAGGASGSSGGASSGSGVRLEVHRARWVLPVAVPPIADGAVVIAARSGEPGIIRAVGPLAELRHEHREANVDVIDHGEAVLLPALVNAHVHLELSHLAGRLPAGLDFVGWLEIVARAAAELSDERSDERSEETKPRPGTEIDDAIESAIGECVATGTALAGEVTNSGRSVRALAHSPLRARIFHELIAFDPRQAEATFAAARTRLAAFESAASGPLLRHSLAPHAPFSASSRLLRLIRGFNGQDGRPTSIHLAESPAEEEFFRTGGGPLAELKRRLGTEVDGWDAPELPSVVYLDRLGWFGSPGLAVHCTQLSARGIEILRRAPITACLCPRSNRALGVGTAPARELAAAGVPLALGTDSLASVESLSLFDEMAAAMGGYGLPPATILEAATRGGARALGFGGELGELAAGRLAAVIAVTPAPGVRVADPYELVFGRPDRDSIHWAAGLGRAASASPTEARDTLHG